MPDGLAQFGTCSIEGGKFFLLLFICKRIFPREKINIFGKTSLNILKKFWLKMFGRCGENKGKYEI